jgi:hypothetical protein
MCITAKLDAQCPRWVKNDAAEKVVVRKQLRRSHVLAFFKALSRTVPCWLPWSRAALASLNKASLG